MEKAIDLVSEQEVYRLDVDAKFYCHSDCDLICAVVCILGAVVAYHDLKDFDYQILHFVLQISFSL